MSTVIRRCLWLLWAITLPLSAQTVEYIHTDALGSPVAVTDANRNVIERSEYEPYGSLLNRPLKDGPGYTGHVADAATGLSYMQQRYYDPVIGRFLSVDPITAYESPIGAFNLYKYAANNPYRFTDPDGRAELPAWLERLTPPGDFFRVAGEAIGSLAAYGQGVATGDEHLKQTAIDNMREQVKPADGVNAAMMIVGPRGAKGGTGSYTNTHATGTRYHGKGSEARMRASGAEKAKANNDPVVSQEHKPAANSREAFKDEARRIAGDGGPGKGNYNKIESPGKKYLEQDMPKK